MHDIYKQNNLPYFTKKGCPVCKKIVDKETNICPNCSYDFVNKSIKASSSILNNKPADKKVEKSIFCNECGHKIIGQQKFCGECGARLTKRICSSCNEIVDSSLAFCPFCGEKLTENQGNVDKTDIVVSNQIEPNKQIVNEETPIIEENEEVKVQKEEELQKEINDIKYYGINMGRKRLFLIIEMLLVVFVALIMIMMPILTKENTFKAFVQVINNNIENPLVAGKDIFNYFIDMFNSKSVTLDNTSLIYLLIKGENDGLIFTCIPFIYRGVDLISSTPFDTATIISTVLVLFTYLFITISLLISFIYCFVSMFTASPYKGKTLGLIIISLLFGCVFIYTSIFTNDFKNYDSWLLYAFALCFFIWFIAKIALLKEVKAYEYYKKQNKGTI